MDVLAAGMGEGGGEAWSYHSQPQLATWQRNCELEREKENPPVPKPAVPVDVQHRRARRPFQDNTNRNRQTGTVLTAPLKKPAADEVHGNSSGSKQQQQQRNSLKELVPPLNVARLAPVQQELRNGVVSVCMLVDSEGVQNSAGLSGVGLQAQTSHCVAHLIILATENCLYSSHPWGS